MTACLLDVNFLVALLWPAHEHHARAVSWFQQNRARGWATCPLTQMGFVRVVSNPAFSRDAVQPWEAVQVLAANTRDADHVFWPDALPVEEAVGFAGLRLAGHRQLTDAYLLGLAIRHGGRLATLDRAVLDLTAPDSPEREAVELVS
ncbi:TA system VapC family ribonuclease toxin [Limisphaera sp. VF-2]|jgi:toxin-antitoxin system PIN domain toxin|uniref:TA system VapC family ribonuclease toxin n=1 Tax=Limisphaera sp. VF-2 TaxID=3400418 RepID=UPI001777BD1F